MSEARHIIFLCMGTALNPGIPCSTRKQVYSGLPLGRVPVTTFAAGGIATPADAAFMMNLGCDGIFVGSGVFKSEDPQNRATAIVLACSFHDEPDIVLDAQKMINEKKSMDGIDMSVMSLESRWEVRGSDI